MKNRERIDVVAVSALCLACSLSVACGGSEPVKKARENAPKSIPLTYRDGLNEEANYGTEPWQTRVDRGTYARRATKPGEAVSRPPDADELEAIQRLALEAEKIRKLRFIRPVDIRIQNRAAMTEYIRSKTKRRDIDRMRIRYQALGMLEESISTDDIMKEIDKTEALGYYDPDLNRLVVRDDVAPGLLLVGARTDQVEQRSAILHELVHALQDQHFHIKRALDQERSADERAARMALVEGDATLAMINYFVKRVGIKFESVIRNPETFRHVIGIERVMAFSRQFSAAELKLMFRYQRGALFVAGLLDKGSWKEVNRAFRAMPTTTTAIYEYQRYRDKWRPARIKSPSRPALRRAGYKVVQSDVLGRLELDVYISRGVTDTEKVTAEWNGDRLLILERKGKYASYWIIHLNDPRSTEVVLNLAKEGYEAAAVEAKIPYRVEAYGQYVLIMRNIPPKLGEKLVEEFTVWTGKNS